MAIGINIEELYKILEMTPAWQNVDIFLIFG